VSPSEEHLSFSPEETRALGEELGRRLRPGEVVAFSGDLGAGKTCMIQGVCAGLGVEDQVNSPTFILIGEYAGQVGGRVVPIYHFDLYRLRGEKELEALGAEEYFYNQGICLIEWPERAGSALPPRRREVTLEHRGPEVRRILIKALPSPFPDCRIERSA